jgi:hypothetical protein
MDFGPQRTAQPAFAAGPMPQARMTGPTGAGMPMRAPGQTNPMQQGQSSLDQGAKKVASALKSSMSGSPTGQPMGGSGAPAMTGPAANPLVTTPQTGAPGIGLANAAPSMNMNTPQLGQDPMQMAGMGGGSPAMGSIFGLGGGLG